MSCQEQVNSVENEESGVGLAAMPTDVLLLLLDYLEYEDLVHLSHSCKRFYSIVKDDAIWMKRSRCALVTNLLGEGMNERLFQNLNPIERVRLSRNWKTGRFKEEVKFCLDSKYMPWLCLGEDKLWFSRGNMILAFKRKTRTNRVDVDRRSCISLHGHQDDVCRFTYRDGIILSGGRDTSIFGYSTDSSRYVFQCLYAHDSDVTAVDLFNQTVVSGSRDCTIKVWRKLENELDLFHLHTIFLSDRVLSAALRPTTDECIVGSSGLTSPPLHIYNLERGIEVFNFCKVFKQGAGVLDMHWETPQSVLTTGYDTYVRLWDCRTGSNVLSWSDPFDSSIYCLASDNMYTILAGTSNHGRVQLWDKRKTKSVQMFFLSSRYSKNSSVYSLTFDPHNLYVALDQSLNVLDFTGYKNKARNMSSVM